MAFAMRIHGKTVTAASFYNRRVGCIYCMALEVPDAGVPVPAPTDHRAWRAIARHHRAGCDWVARRARGWPEAKPEHAAAYEAERTAFFAAAEAVAAHVDNRTA